MIISMYVYMYVCMQVCAYLRMYDCRFKHSCIVYTIYRYARGV